MSKYNLLKSVSITRLSMFMRNCPHPDHAQVKVGHTHTQLIWSSENMISLLHSSQSSSEMKYYLDTL